MSQTGRDASKQSKPHLMPNFRLQASLPRNFMRRCGTRHWTVARDFVQFLVVMTGEMFGVDTEVLLDPAAAIECIHAYSLVHDDLPCMDDDQYRRGKLSCFAAYDEATAGSRW